MATGLFVAVFGTSACDLLEVTNAGLIEDEDLNDPTFVGALVAGMSADFSRAMNAAGPQRSSVMAFEITSGLSDQGEHVIGYLDPDIVDRQGTWDAWHRARWVASAGVTRIKEALGADYDQSPDAARANLWAGFSNRLLGESVCHAVIDGGPAQPREVHFELAEAYFSEAARIAETAGAEAQETYLAALGGRASVRAWQGNWDGAVADASLVPASFVFLAQFATAGVRNGFYSEQFGSRYLTMMASPWENVTDDPRVPWSKTAILEDGVAAPTRGGDYRAWPQMKYTTEDSDIPITHGPEMLVLRAEAALRAGDIAGMTNLLKESRALWEMDPVAQPTSEAEAWELFKFERGATVWLEHRGFWDRARWYEEGRDTLLEGRAKCYPIGRREIDSNPNLSEFR
ncbi:MAG: hypothetical protein GEU90_08025 [Gemmatimonas sp.]|nr:hypothetical protein [Gemmatimonas sp.]